MDIDPVSIASCVRNLSPSSSLSLIQKTKTAKKRKAEEELAPQLSDHEKRPQQVAMSDIPLVRNADAWAKVLKHEGLKFLVPVRLSWLYKGNKRELSINALVDTSAEAMIFDINFVEQMMMPWVKRETRLRLESADGSIVKRSDTVQVKNVMMFVLDARSGKNKTHDLVTEVACLEPGCLLILGFDWIMAECDKLSVTTPYGLELKRALEIEEVTDFSEFGEILKQSSYVSLIHVGKWESRHLLTSKTHRILSIIVGKDLKTLAERLPVQYRDFVQIFGKAAQASLPAHGPQDMVIDLEPGKQPPSAKLYPLSPDELELLKEYLDEMLRTGKILPSKSSARGPIFFAKQANGKLRIVVDYRDLNTITVKDKYPLPLMTTLMEQVGTSQVFSKLDLKLGFNLLWIAEGDECKTAFKTRYGLYEYTVMPFGLTNAPSVFQRYLDNILSEKIDCGVVVYIDDI